MNDSVCSVALFPVVSMVTGISISEEVILRVLISTTALPFVGGSV